MSSSQKTLNVICIIVIIFAIIDIIIGLMTMLGGGAISALSGTSEGASKLASSGYDSETGIAAGLIVLVGGLVIVIDGVVDLIVGILGRRGIKDPSKMGPFRVICIIGIVLAAIGLISAICSVSGSNIVSCIITLALLIWCLYLANKIQNEGTPIE